MFDISTDKNICLGIARGIAPFKTGNLRWNAIYSFSTNDGFGIGYSLQDAFYVYFLEEGTKNVGGQKHVGFIANKTVPAMANYLYNKYTLRNKKNTMFYSDYAKRANVFGLTTNLEERAKVNAFSLKQDIEKIAKENKWQHNFGIEETVNFKTKEVLL